MLQTVTYDGVLHNDELRFNRRKAELSQCPQPYPARRHRLPSRASHFHPWVGSGHAGAADDVRRIEAEWTEGRAATQASR